MIKVMNNRERIYQHNQVMSKEIKMECSKVVQKYFQRWPYFKNQKTSTQMQATSEIF